MSAENPAPEQFEANKINSDDSIASCARADTKFQDRDTQIKYDIAKNEGGPLKRTMKRSQTAGDASAPDLQPSFPTVRDNVREPDAKSHPGLAARMEAIEEHLGVRFGTCRSLFILLACLSNCKKYKFHLARVLYWTD